jgi:hypothetical protein
LHALAFHREVFYVDTFGREDELRIDHQTFDRLIKALIALKAAFIDEVLDDPFNCLVLVLEALMLGCVITMLFVYHKYCKAKRPAEGVKRK